MHDFAGVGITVATVLAATLLSSHSVNTLRSELRTEIGNLRSKMIGKLDAIQKDMREFYAEQARHDLRINALEQRKN